MLLKFKFKSSFSFMGFPDSPKLLSAEKDLQATECNFLSRPSKEFPEVCQISPSKERVVADFDQQPAQEELDGDRNLRKGEGASRVLFASSLTVKLPEVREEVIAEGEKEDGLTTPTSPDHKISTPVCPPAPRKPKSISSTTAAANQKRSRRRVFLDLSSEVESMFPASILADFGKNIKKVRKESVLM